MGDVLSQSEIDNLLQALNSGELDVDEMQDKNEKQVRNYGPTNRRINMPFMPIHRFMVIT